MAKDKCSRCAVALDYSFRWLSTAPSQRIIALWVHPLKVVVDQRCTNIKESCPESYSEIGHLVVCYTPYEDPFLANQKSRKLGVFDRKLEGATPHFIIMISIRDNETKIVFFINMN